MSEEEVGKALAEKNQEIYLNKLLKDLDQNYENLKIVFNNIIIALNSELDTRIYDILFEGNKNISKEDLAKYIKGFLKALLDYLINGLDGSKEALMALINNNNYQGYINELKRMLEELCNGLNVVYLERAKALLEKLSSDLDDFTKTRLENLIKEIIFNRFVTKVKSSVDNTALAISNNLEENNIHLAHMNEKTIK